MENRSSEEWRKYPRKHLGIPVEVHFEGMNAPLRLQTSDLSVGGCYVETMFPQPVGSKLTMVFWIGEKKIETDAVVATCTPQFGNGIRFTRMADADREMLSTFLESSRL